jgi:hypothetical protein
MSYDTNARVDLTQEYPQIEDITGTVTFNPSVGGPDREVTSYTKANLPSGFLRCRQSTCKSGGIRLGELFRHTLAEMVRNHQTEGTFGESCRGYQDMGRHQQRPCRSISVHGDIHIVYKNA